MDLQSVVEERRKYKRTNVYIPVRIITPDNRQESGYTINLSEKGALILCRKNYLPGTPVTISFDSMHKGGINDTNYYRADIVRVEDFNGTVSNDNEYYAIALNLKDSLELTKPEERQI